MNLVASLYEQHGTHNPLRIAASLGYVVRYFDMPERIPGRYQPMPSGIDYILISESIRDTPSELFVCAHELFHAIEHRDSAAYYIATFRSHIKCERDADEFAAALLQELFPRYAEEDVFRYINRVGIPGYMIDFITPHDYPFTT